MHWIKIKLWPITSRACPCFCQKSDQIKLILVLMTTACRSTSIFYLFIDLVFEKMHQCMLNVGPYKVINIQSEQSAITQQVEVASVEMEPETTSRPQTSN